MTKSPDLSRFFGLDTADLPSSILEITRELFAGAICRFALECKDTREFIEGLIFAMPPESQLSLPTKIGEGSCRVVYSLPFDLVVKIPRRSALRPTDLASRGGAKYLPILWERRAISSLNELVFATRYPNVLPRIDGAMFCFGPVNCNLDCIVMEQVTPLTLYAPEDNRGIAKEDIYLTADEELSITDSRFSTRTPQSTDRIFEELFDPNRSDQGVWLGNLGVTCRRTYCLIDAGNYGNPFIVMDAASHFYPSVEGEALWETCLPGGDMHRWQTQKISDLLMSTYRTHSSKKGGSSHER